MVDLASDRINMVGGLVGLLGRIVERGTHAELLRARGLYADLCRTQFEPAGAMLPRDGAAPGGREATRADEEGDER